LSPLSRRAALSLFALGTAGAARLGPAVEELSRRHRPRAAAGGTDNAIVRENAEPGHPGWRKPAGIRAANDVRRQIQGYAAATSVAAGESLDLHVSVATARTYTVSVYRIGHYGGTGGRLMLVSPRLPGEPRPVPTPAAGTGLIECDWPVSWTLAVPRHWTSGYYLAVFDTDDGFRHCTPFVVRDDSRAADFLLVAPFSTYQAYNLWPADGRTGKSLYKGYREPGQLGGLAERAFQVSFDRPYTGSGLPSWSSIDIAAVQWLESGGFDVSYATSQDLHEQRIVPRRHAGLIFSGHDEYWSTAMREGTERAVADGTHLAFLAANNMYWRIRFDAAGDGRRNRVVTCYKSAADPHAEREGPTVTWRSIAKGRYAEQRLLGVQYNGILARPVPLIVNEADHWFWADTGLSDGDTVPGLVAVECDGHDPAVAVRPGVRSLLSNTPYEDRLGRGTRVQNTSLHEAADGTLVFVAGTFHWNLALADSGYADDRIRQATGNLLHRMLRARA
jgi:hypothetical protein